jgi:proteasome lid subunit RPN8/RPN11
VTTLILDSELRSQLEREARAAFPRECCGLVEGICDADSLRVIALRQTRNVAVAPDRFEIDPAEHFRVLRAARGNEAKIIGCYHSHPNGNANPSARDRAGASEEGFVWLIASLTVAGPAKLSAFVWRSNAFEPVAIEQMGAV